MSKHPSSSIASIPGITELATGRTTLLATAVATVLATAFATLTTN